MNNKIKLEKEIAWASQNMPRTLRQVAALPDLSEVRLACCMHLDMKMIPLVQGILEKIYEIMKNYGYEKYIPPVTQPRYRMRWSPGWWSAARRPAPGAI